MFPGRPLEAGHLADAKVMGPIEELAFAFQEGPATVKKLDDFHYLILETDGAKSDEERWAAGEGALKRMNAICLVRDNRFRCPAISGLSRRDPSTGKISTVVSLRCNMQARFGIPATPTVRNADGSIRLAHRGASF